MWLRTPILRRWNWWAWVVANLAVWRDRSYANKEWLVVLESLFKVAKSKVAHHVGCIIIVPDLDFLWVSPVALDVLKRRIVILVRMFADEEVLRQWLAR